MTLNLANQQPHPAVALMLHSGTVQCLNALHKIGLDTSIIGFWLCFYTDELDCIQKLVKCLGVLGKLFFKNEK